MLFSVIWGDAKPLDNPAGIRGKWKTFKWF